MSTKIALFLVVRVSVRSEGKTKFNLWLPLPAFVVSSLASSLEDLACLAGLFASGDNRKKLKLIKNAATALDALMRHMMFNVGRYDFVEVDAGDGYDGGDRVKVSVLLR